jgi:RNA polymerase sigma-70 factor (ECF subfamily)
VSRHGPLVLGVCRRVLGDVHEADDAFQATFLVLARSAGTIRRQRSLACWLHGVAYRIASRLAKEKWRHMEPLLHEMPEDGVEVFDQIAQRDEQRLVDEELNRLPEKDRHALTLRYLHDLSNEEMADTMAFLNSLTSNANGSRESSKTRPSPIQCSHYWHANEANGRSSA